ncbi:MAG: hypothetical protein JRH16_14690 [Deltaproteobacteria bacterium]|nr:hypothetical protein [Deltaproteobacteria bacterium]MBW2362700.1 hypothetical protein [Deltaproteobacteria bacterium]
MKTSNVCAKRAPLIIALLSIGCASTYAHPTKSQQEFDADRAACHEKAAEATIATDNPLDTTNRGRNRVLHRCLTEKGWYKTDAASE